MSQFDFFMAFYGLLLGLGVAELLGGFAGLLREKTPPRLGLRLPLLGLLTFTEMMANFVDAWNRLQGITITLPTLFAPTLVGVAYYVVAVILVPRDLADWPSLDLYYQRRKRWIVGLLLAVNALISFSFLPAGVLGNLVTLQWDASVRGLLIASVWLLGGYCVLLFARRPWLEIAAMAALLVFYALTYGPVNLHILG